MVNFKQPMLFINIILLCVILVQWQEIKNLVKNYLPIRYVRIEGVFQHLAKEDIQDALQPLVNTDFLSADLQAIRAATMALPWVAQADIKRVWPDAIDIRVYEQQAVMRWGENSLLNAQGEIFTLQNTDQHRHLPLLICPAGQQRKFKTEMQELQAILEPHDLVLDSFVVTERLSWQLMLDNGIQMQLGRTEPLQNLHRFLKTIALLGKDKIAAIAKIDMRYPNGFAVQWKPGMIIDWKALEDSKA